jgi:hypothetical protein
LNKAVRSVQGARWSQTNKCWYVPLSKEYYNKLFFAFKGKAVIEQTALHKYLSENKKFTEPEKISTPEKQVPVEKPVLITNLKSETEDFSLIEKQVTVYKSGKIQAVNAHIIPGMEQHLKLKAYSPSTIKTYLGEMSQLLSMLDTIPADDLTPEHLKSYLIHCYEKLKLTENTLHSRINAMKFYYEQVLKREKFFWDIPRL